jgi:glutamyl-tRNA reductase
MAGTTTVRSKVEMAEVHENIGCDRWEIALDVAPAVHALQTAIDTIAQAELRRFQSKLRTLTPDQREAVQLLVRGIAHRILHPVVSSLKQAAFKGDLEAVARICELFGVAPLPLRQAGEDAPGLLALDHPELLTA